MPANARDELVTMTEAAHLLGISPLTLRKILQAGKLGEPRTDPVDARRRLLLRADVERLAAQSIGPKETAA